MRFDHSSEEHLEWVLKLAYRHVVGDMDVTQREAQDALCDALCNLIGDDAFCDFCSQERN